MSAAQLDHIAGNSAPAPRNVPGGSRFAGLRAFGALLLIAVLIVVAIAVNRAWTRYRHGNPDPHGQLFHVLLEARAALPNPQISTASEPRWETTGDCHDPGSKSGWSDVTVTAEAAAVRPTTEMLSTAEAAMARRGWRLADMSASPHPFALWSKRIESQATATDQLSIYFIGESPEWSLAASAPPATNPEQGGCP